MITIACRLARRTRIIEEAERTPRAVVYNLQNNLFFSTTTKQKSQVHTPSTMPHNAQASSSTDVSDHANGRDSSATISEPSTPRTSGEHEQEHKTPKFKFSPTMILENNGSVARDHLASERTFLAYVRTSLAISSAGVGERHSFISWIQTLISILSFGSTIPDIDGKFTGPSFCEASWSNCRHHRADCAPHR